MAAGADVLMMGYEREDIMASRNLCYMMSCRYPVGDVVLMSLDRWIEDGLSTM